ncbi:MAG: Hsp20/alpha crystallin family protein [Deltaproteobacteria bacterium]|nr:Hsp20/alpha crystallin family protein [Deltaproteobacteria bacterium]
MNIRDLVPSVWRRSGVPVTREEEEPFFSLQREMNRLFDDFFRGFDDMSFGLSRDRFRAFSPSVDIKENDKEVLIKAELPGMDEKDIDVNLFEDRLTIKGEKKEEKEDKGSDYYHMESSYGSFNRIIPLPEKVDTKKVEANFKNGVLSIKLPKTEEAKAKGKKIPIQTTKE